MSNRTLVDQLRLADEGYGVFDLAEQRMSHMERFGGAETVRATGLFSRSPIPGKTVEVERV